MKKNLLKLKRHETFSIREGWLEKGINIINLQPLCLRKDSGPKYFGLGSNMCKSLRYWLDATKIASFSTQNGAELTEFGRLLLNYDSFLEKNFSWWMIHLYLVTNFQDAPVFNRFFNMDYSKFEKDLIFRYIKDSFSNYDIGSESSLDADISMVLRSYFSDDFSNPENNMNCPLGKLNLLGMFDKKTYVKTQPSISSLDYRIVYYSLLKCYDIKAGQSFAFNMEDIFNEENNPLAIFNLSKSTFLIYLEEMKNRNYITLIKTAGLNTVTIEEAKDLNMIFSSYFQEV